MSPGDTEGELRLVSHPPFHANTALRIVIRVSISPESVAPLLAMSGVKLLTG
jgi:hypothetical protein